ncbi:MAG: D-alanyl-D-alanine carboxypeptidase family protein [Candidatus Malihini olakiniferum]
MSESRRSYCGAELDIYMISIIHHVCLGGRRLPLGNTSGGYFPELSDWLSSHIAQFNFYWPFAHYRGGVAVESWHISYALLAKGCRVVDARHYSGSLSTCGYL